MNNRICPRCRQAKPIIEPSKDYPWGRDPCLCELWSNPKINYSCCGHGKNEEAYITTTDGYRFVMKESVGNRMRIKIDGEYVSCIMGINPYVTMELADGRVFYLQTVERRLE